MWVLAFRPRGVARAVAEEPQPPLGADPRVELADAAGRDVAGVGERRLARFCCSSFSSTRSELVM